MIDLWRFSYGLLTITVVKWPRLYHTIPAICITQFITGNHCNFHMDMKTQLKVTEHCDVHRKIELDNWYDMTTIQLHTKKMMLSQQLWKVPNGFSQIHSFPIYHSYAAAYRCTLYATAHAPAPRCAYFEFPAISTCTAGNVQCMVHGGFKCCPMCLAICTQCII